MNGMIAKTKKNMSLIKSNSFVKRLMICGETGANYTIVNMIVIVWAATRIVIYLNSLPEVSFLGVIPCFIRINSLFV